MKCDELKAFKQGSVELGEYWVYNAEDVDAAIAELKQKIEDEREFGLNRAKSADHEIGKLCAELCELNAENRRLKRALWLAHAYKAKFKRWWLHLALDCEASAIRPDTKTINRIKGKIGNCEKSERKCRAKAEQYEEDK